jgi:hypothetical protein
MIPSEFICLQYVGSDTLVTPRIDPFPRLTWSCGDIYPEPVEELDAVLSNLRMYSPRFQKVVGLRYVDGGKFHFHEYRWKSGHVGVVPLEVGDYVYHYNKDKFQLVLPKDLDSSKFAQKAASGRVSLHYNGDRSMEYTYCAGYTVKEYHHWHPNVVLEVLPGEAAELLERFPDKFDVVSNG